MAASEIFEQIRLAGWAGLQAWEARGEPESFELEFKGKGHEAPELGPFDRVSIAKATSGFANMSGGVLIIGVDTRKEDGVDRADKLQPAKSLRAYVDAVNRHLAVCTDPRVPGAHAVGIECADDEGVVVVLVPGSDGGPHRAKGRHEAGDKYFARQGVQTIVLEHSLLSAMFGRVPPPILSIEAEQRRTSNGLTFLFGVRNSGRGVARNVLLRIQVDAQHGEAPSIARHEPPGALAGWTRVQRLSSRSVGAWCFSFGSLIYPDDDLTAVQFDFKAVPRFNVLRYRGRIDAEGMAPAEFDCSLPVAG